MWWVGGADFGVYSAYYLAGPRVFFDMQQTLLQVRYDPNTSGYTISDIVQHTKLSTLICVGYYCTVLSILTPSPLFTPANLSGEF